MLIKRRKLWLVVLGAMQIGCFYAFITFLPVDPARPLEVFVAVLLMLGMIFIASVISVIVAAEYAERCLKKSENAIRNTQKLK